MSVEEMVKEYVGRVANRFRIEGAILFGSRARGDHGPWSDADILFIGDFKAPYLERLGDLLRLAAGIKIPVEPHPYTPKESLEMLERGSPTIVDALEEGRILIEGPGLGLLLKRYGEMKSQGRLRRTKCTITF